MLSLENIATWVGPSVGVAKDVSIMRKQDAETRKLYSETKKTDSETYLNATKASCCILQGSIDLANSKRSGVARTFTKVPEEAVHKAYEEIDKERDKNLAKIESMNNNDNYLGFSIMRRIGFK